MPYTLEPRGGVLTQKVARNSLLVSLLKGSKECFWAFEGPCEATSCETAPLPALPVASGADGAAAEECAAAASVHQEEDEHREKVQVLRVPSAAHYEGLKGFVHPELSTASSRFVSFPNGAPSRKFRPAQLRPLPADAHMLDRLTHNVPVWVHRGPGLSGPQSAFLRTQKFWLRKGRAKCRMLGWDADSGKFLLVFDHMEPEDATASLSFNQTLIVADETSDGSCGSSGKKKEASSGPSTDPKALSSDADPKALSTDDERAQG